MQSDEWDLLQRYTRDGSQSAFAELAHRYVDFVYGCCQRQLGDPHLAEDVTQGVFLVLATKARRLGRETILSAWLFQIARYACGSAIRMRSRRRRHESAAARPSDAGVQSEDHAMDELKPLLDQAVGQLRQTDRHAVLLRYFEGRSVKEVAGVMGVSENAAAKRLSRAIAKLRATFAQRGVVLEASVVASAVEAASRTDAPAIIRAAAIAAAEHSSPTPVAVTIAKVTMHTMKWALLKSAMAMGAAATITIGCGVVLVHRSMSGRSTPAIQSGVSAGSSNSAARQAVATAAPAGSATTPATQPDDAVANNQPAESAAQSLPNTEHGARRRVRYIQVSSMRQVDEVRRRLMAETFSKVARDMSENAASRELGGELPPFGANDANYPAALREAAFALHVGQVSDAIEYKNTFYIIELEGVIPPSGSPQTRPES